MARKVNSTITDALMLMGGGVVGAGLALLLAPRSGRKTRNEIARFGRTIGRKGDKAIRDLTGNVVDIADTMGAKAAGILRGGKGLVGR